MPRLLLEERMDQGRDADSRLVQESSTLRRCVGPRRVNHRQGVWVLLASVGTFFLKAPCEASSPLLASLLARQVTYALVHPSFYLAHRTACFIEDDISSFKTRSLQLERRLLVEKEPEHIGGRLAANFRRANIAEGLAVQMFRPFSAVAEVGREEDHGIDLIATLLRRSKLSLIAEDSFYAQVKIHTSAQFKLKGEGILWYRQLRVPYFPVIMNPDDGSASLYTMNKWHWVLHATLVGRYVFVLPDEMDHPDDFSLGEPLMKWSISESLHEEFPKWAYSVLKPAIQVEAANHLYGPMWRFVELVGTNYEFKDRDAEGLAPNPPEPGKIKNIPPGDPRRVNAMLKDILEQFANGIANTPGLEPRADELLKLKASFRLLGIDPDPTDKWEVLAAEMHEWAKDHPQDEA